jgi:hypothetical protein
VTSPSLTEIDPAISNKEEETTGLPTPPPTAGVFTSALQFIPSSVVPKPKDESRSRSTTLEDQKPMDRQTSRSRSTTIQTDSESTIQDSQDNPPKSPSLPPLSLPSRKSSLNQLSPDPPLDEEIPRIPQTLLDKVVQRKPSSTWPRSLGKKVAPWTSADTTKTHILQSPTWEESPSVPARRMKILKPVRSQHLESDMMGNEEFKSPLVGSKNVGGGAFHWMK